MNSFFKTNQTVHYVCDFLALLYLNILHKNTKKKQTQQAKFECSEVETVCISLKFVETIILLNLSHSSQFISENIVSKHII